MREADEQTLDDVTRRVRERDEHIAALRERIDRLTMREHQLTDELEQARAKHPDCDAEARASCEAIRERDHRLVLLYEQLRDAHETIRMMQATRVWRLGHSYWRARGAIRRLLRRG